MALYIFGAMVFCSVLMFMASIGTIRVSAKKNIARFITDSRDVYEQIKSNVEAESRRRKISEYAGRLKVFYGKLIPGSEMESINKKIMLAGLEDKIRSEEIYFMKMLLSLLFFGIAASLAFVGSGVIGIVVSIIGLLAGYMMPDIYLDLKIAGRRDEIERNILLFADIVTIACESGIGLNDAVKRVSFSLKGVIGNEMIKTFGEIETGRSYKAALEGLQKRSPSESLGVLANMLVQAEKYGTPLTKVLREYALQIRNKRQRMAQEVAQKALVKMTFPILIFMLAPMLFLVISPALMNIKEAFLK